MRLGRLQPAGSHLQDLQGATDGRPAAVLFDRLRHARWQPAQGPGRSHSSRPPPLRPVRHPRRRHLLPAPSIRRAVRRHRLAGPAARGWRLPQVRRALGHENVLRAPSPAAQCTGRGSPPGAACGWPLPAVRRAQGHGWAYGFHTHAHTNAIGRILQGSQTRGVVAIVGWTGQIGPWQTGGSIPPLRGIAVSGRRGLSTPHPCVRHDSAQ